VTHCCPLYKSSFETVYKRALSGGPCLEEQLANAHGFRRVRSAFSKRKPARKVVLNALADWLSWQSPPYHGAMPYTSSIKFSEAQNDLAEANQNESFPGLPRKGPKVWQAAKYAYRRISNINRRVNFLIHRNSPLARRIPANLRALRYREVAQKLRVLAGCEEVGTGKGSHRRWRRPDGKVFSVPCHPGDLRIGILARIIKPAGLSMSVGQFMRA